MGRTLPSPSRNPWVAVLTRMSLALAAPTPRREDPISKADTRDIVNVYTMAIFVS